MYGLYGNGIMVYSSRVYMIHCANEIVVFIKYVLLIYG